MSYSRRTIVTHSKRNKQTYLLANSQFLVLAGYDASIHKADPDWPVDWDSIEEVRFKQTLIDKLSCPVCLDSQLSAAKITKCGHVFCWTCILHYLWLSDDTGHASSHRPCPICFEPVHRDDLRSVLFHTFINYNKGDQIDLRLMVRSDGCVEVSPFEQAGDCSPQAVAGNHRSASAHAASPTPDKDLVGGSGSTQNSLDGFDCQVFGNLIVVNPNAIIQNTVVREQKELLAKLDRGELDEEEKCLLKSAMEFLAKRGESLKQMALKQIQLKIESEQLAASTPPKPTGNQHHHHHHHNHHHQHNKSQQHLQRAKRKFSEEKSYLFYQSNDGQHIYLSPLCAKIIKHEFLEFEASPRCLTARIIHSKHLTMNEANRKRYKHLAHLPISCEFQLIEIDFEQSDIVSESTYNIFRSEISKRESERRKQEQQERKRDKLWLAQQKRKIYNVHGLSLPASSKIDINNPDQFPSVSDERFAKSLPKARTSSDFVDDLNEWISDNDDEANEQLAGAISPPPIEAGNSPQLAGPPVTQSQPANLQESDTSAVAAAGPANLPLSFKDIQLEQQALAVSEKVFEKQASNPWNRRSQANRAQSTADSNIDLNQQLQQNSSGSQTASFAQLLVNAKSNPKNWSRTPKLANCNGSPSTNSEQTSNKPTRMSEGSEESGMELRAPTVTEFCLSDFIIKKRSKRPAVKKTT